MPEDETSIEFQYPEMVIPEDMKEEIDEYTTKQSRLKTVALMVRLFDMLKEEKKPQYMLAALLLEYKCFDNNTSGGTLAAVARHNDMSEELLRWYRRKVRNKMIQYGLDKS